MPAKGYKSVRKLPTTNGKNYNTTIEKFFESHEVCSECGGRGFHLDDEQVSIYEGVASIKFTGTELEKLEDAGHLNGEVIKKIIETVDHNRTQCDECKGFGFIKNQGRKNGKQKTKLTN